MKTKLRVALIAVTLLATVGVHAEGTTTLTFHRYGFSDLVKTGLAGDAAADHVNFGARVTINFVRQCCARHGVTDQRAAVETAWHKGRDHRL